MTFNMLWDFIIFEELILKLLLIYKIIRSFQLKWENILSIFSFAWNRKAYGGSLITQKSDENP